MAPAFILFNAVSGTGNTKAGFIMEMLSLTAVSYTHLPNRAPTFVPPM